MYKLDEAHVVKHIESENVLIAACSNLRYPHKHYLEEHFGFLEHFTLAVVCRVLNAESDLVQRFDDQLIQEILPVCELFENLVTLRNCIVEHLVQHFDGAGICAIRVYQLVLK